MFSSRTPEAKLQTFFGCYSDVHRRDRVAEIARVHVSYSLAHRCAGVFWVGPRDGRKHAWVVFRNADARYCRKRSCQRGAYTAQ
jgi:hypothetical protein